MQKGSFCKRILNENSFQVKIWDRAPRGLDFFTSENPVNSLVKWKILKLFTSYNNFWIKKEQLAGL